MNTSQILLLGIILIIFLMITNILYLIISECTIKNEHINNDLPDNQITQLGNDNLLIPTSDQVYNPNDGNRPNNSDSHQVTNINNINSNTDLANTDPSIPIIYINDQLEDTSYVTNTPSLLINSIDTGSGIIEQPTDINNNALNNFSSIE
jgi:hypothetical protein